MDSKILGLRIRQARENLGMSQEDLAETISKDQKAISEYENGRRKLAVTDLPTLASALQVPITFFFEEDAEFQDLDAAVLNYFHQFESLDDRQALIDVMGILSKLVQRNRT